MTHIYMLSNEHDAEGRYVMKEAADIDSMQTKGGISLS